MKARTKVILWIVGLVLGGLGVEIAATENFDYQVPVVGIWFVTLCVFVAVAYEAIAAYRATHPARQVTQGGQVSNDAAGWRDAS